MPRSDLTCNHHYGIKQILNRYDNVRVEKSILGRSSFKIGTFKFVGYSWQLTKEKPGKQLSMSLVVCSHLAQDLRL